MPPGVSVLLREPPSDQQHGAIDQRLRSLGRTDCSASALDVLDEWTVRTDDFSWLGIPAAGTNPPQEVGIILYNVKDLEEEYPEADTASMWAEGPLPVAQRSDLAQYLAGFYPSPPRHVSWRKT